jgi:hypothetical protein
MRVPNWGVWMMFAGSAIGAILLFAELRRRGFPSPLSN